MMHTRREEIMSSEEKSPEKLGINIDKIETIAKECFGFGVGSYIVETGLCLSVQWVLEEGYTCNAEELVKFITEVSKELVTPFEKVILSIDSTSAKHVTLGITFQLEDKTR